MDFAMKKEENWLFSAQTKPRKIYKNINNKKIEKNQAYQDYGMSINNKFYHFDGNTTSPLELQGGVGSSTMVTISASGSNK